MRKFVKIAATSLLALALVLPLSVFAHDGESGESFEGDIRAGFKGVFRASSEGDHEGENRFRIIDVDRILDSERESRRGEVTAVASGSFTLSARDGKIYTVTTANASFALPFNGTFAAADLKVGDAVKVKGTISGSTITAAEIIVVPANTVKAKAKGTVSAVNGSTLTVNTKGGNTITVNTSSDTEVTKADGSTGAMADVTVGSRVSIKGLWNTLMNSLTALAIKLKLAA